MTSTSRAKRAMPVQVCLLRSSQRMSFQRMASTCSRKIMMPPPPWYPQGAPLHFWSYATPDVSTFQRYDAVGEFEGVVALVRREEDGAVLFDVLAQECLQ